MFKKLLKFILLEKFFNRIRASKSEGRTSGDAYSSRKTADY